MHVTTLGIDLAKQVFQLHGVDARGYAVLSRRVKRSQLVAAVASLGPALRILKLDPAETLRSE
jgi:transposase